MQSRDQELLKITNRLSMQCRYGGDVRRFYSVAEHTVHMVRQARSENATVRLQLWLWLHDTPENKIGDLLPVVKSDPIIAPVVKDLEQQEMRRICGVLGLPMTDGEGAMSSPDVKSHDIAVTCAEAKFVAHKQVIEATGKPWAPFEDREPRHVEYGVRLQRAAPFGDKFEFWALAMAQEFEVISQGMTQ